MAKIILMLKDRVLRELQVGENGLKIGRDPGNDIQLENPAVSRVHAEIYRQGWPYYLEDKKSTNGTYLNGTFLNWKSALAHNDRITIGKPTLVFQEEARDRRDGNKPSLLHADETMCLHPDGKGKSR